jgi:arylsulfatase A-like enzyme
LKRKPNIILIVMDTVRADHLSCYGYFRKTTPNIDKIANQGVLFENAFSAAPWTPPSHASIFSGRYPSDHKTIGRNISLNKDVPVIPEILSQKHYRTIGITCCRMLNHESGFSRGFDKYVDVSAARKTTRDVMQSITRGPDKGAYLANATIKKLLKEHIQKNKQQPFFMFINYFESHTPYDPPRPFKSKFCNKLTQSKIYLNEFILRKFLAKTTERFADNNLDISRLQFIASGGGGFSFAAKKLSISDKEWAVVKSWYDGEINYLDSRIGELISFLKDSGIFENTILVLTADHGEIFGEHGLAVHPLCLYDSVLRVPLIFSGPPIANHGKRLSQIVSTVDIFPTILDIAGVKASDKIAGRTLYPFNERQTHKSICAEYGGLHLLSLRAKYVLEELNKIDQGCKCVRTDNYKYIYSVDKEELYDVKNDPAEKVNLISKLPEKAQSLKKELQSSTDISFFGPKTFSDKTEMLNRLKALGYL